VILLELQILAGDDSVFIELRHILGTWYCMLISVLLYTNPTVQATDLQDHAHVSPPHSHCLLRVYCEHVQLNRPRVSGHRYLTFEHQRVYSLLVWFSVWVIVSVTWWIIYSLYTMHCCVHCYLVWRMKASIGLVIVTICQCCCAEFNWYVAMFVMCYSGSDTFHESEWKSFTSVGFVRSVL